MYHVYCGKYRITDYPISMQEILIQYKSIKRLELEGFRLIKVGDYL